MKPGLVAALAGLTLLLAPIPEVRPDDPARDGSVASLAGAAFRPVWRHLLWMDVSAALASRQYIDALSTLRRLEVADGRDWKAAAFRAHVLAYNIGARESSPGERAARVVDAVKILDRAFARTSAPELRLAAGVLLMEPWVGAPDVSVRVERALKSTPTEAAAKRFAAGVAAAPGSGELRVGAVDATRLRSIEILSRGGAFDDAAAAAALAARFAEPLAPSAARALAVAWNGWLSAVSGASSADVGTSVASVASAIASAEAGADAPGVETLLFQAALPGVARVAETRLARGDADGCLSVLRAALSIPTRPSSGISHPRSTVDRVVAILDRVAETRPALATEAAALKERMNGKPR